jgi:hypothetical protein
MNQRPRLPVTFNDMPTELIIQIFELLMKGGSPSVAARIRSCCKRFRSVVDQVYMSIRHIMSLSSSMLYMSDAPFTQFVSLFTVGLKMIELKNPNFVYPKTVVKVLQTCTSLEEIYINSAPHLWVPDLSVILERTELPPLKLKKLVISCSPPSEKYAKQKFLSFWNLPDLNERSTKELLRDSVSMYRSIIAKSAINLDIVVPYYCPSSSEVIWDAKNLGLAM